MSIVERQSRGGSRFAVRVHLGRGAYQWVGTFASREAAEEAERLARPAKARRCVKCRRKFTPSDDRRVTCDACVKRHAPPSIEDHWLYRCFDSDGELLYVGITSVGIKRFRRHGNDKSWWAQIDTIRVQHFDTREEAHAAEQSAIQTESPRYNLDFNKPAPPEKFGERSLVPCPFCGRSYQMCEAALESRCWEEVSPRGWEHR